MAEQINKLYRRKNLQVVVTAFPEGADANSKHAIQALFQNHAEAFYGIRNGFSIENGVFKHPESAIVFEYSEKDKKTYTTFFEYWAKTFVSGKEHSLCYGVPRIGADLLFIEVDNGVLIDAWFEQNAIPISITAIDQRRDRDEQLDSHVPLEVYMKGFSARNEAVRALAQQWLYAQSVTLKAAEAQQEKPDVGPSDTATTAEVASSSGGLAVVADVAVAEANTGVPMENDAHVNADVAPRDKYQSTKDYLDSCSPGQ